MKRVLAVIVLALSATAAAASPADDQKLADQLVALERQSWVAWQAHDGKFFERFLSDDHIELGASGVASKANVVGYVGAGKCVVASYEVKGFRFTRIAPDVAVLIYFAAQDTTCGTVHVPSPVWATSVFALRDGEWKNVLYQHVPAITPKR